MPIQIIIDFSNFWEIIQTLILLFTLIVVYRYTRETIKLRNLAKEHNELINSQFLLLDDAKKSDLLKVKPRLKVSNPFGQKIEIISEQNIAFIEKISSEDIKIPNKHFTKTLKTGEKFEFKLSSLKQKPDKISLAVELKDIYRNSYTYYYSGTKISGNYKFEEISQE